MLRGFPSFYQTSLVTYMLGFTIFINHQTMLLANQIISFFFFLFTVRFEARYEFDTVCVLWRLSFTFSWIDFFYLGIVFFLDSKESRTFRFKTISHSPRNCTDSHASLPDLFHLEYTCYPILYLV